MHSSPILAVIVICIFNIGIACALSIASIVIGSQYMSGVTCDANSFIRLSTWLITYGSVNLAGAIAAVFVVIAILNEIAPVASIIYLVLLGLFNFAWNIVGAVALFRDSPACQSLSYSLWAMVLAVLIVQWIGMVASCFSKNRND